MKNMKIIADLAQQHDAQVWVERTTDGQPVGIVIEDGQVAASQSEGDVAA
ncbi:MAG: hypothetical protein H6815_00270 [Phycisphaeraceae bacterium]|nr:hypothetical protein [Phycisphaerales bacterium]MCB9858858.1 hypothetical protein [Phycisphaeraceae bacterium]